MALITKRTIPNTDIELDAYIQIKAFRFDLPSRVYLALQAKQDADAAEAIESWDEPIELADIGEGVKGDLTMANLYEALKAKEEYADAVDA